MDSHFGEIFRQTDAKRFPIKDWDAKISNRNEGAYMSLVPWKFFFLIYKQKKRGSVERISRKSELLPLDLAAPLVLVCQVYPRNKEKKKHVIEYTMGMAALEDSLGG